MKDKIKSIQDWLAGFSAVTLVIGGTIFGILFWGGFNWSMELTNTEEFCISCHEMEQNVYLEYQDTVHYSNKTGVRATCPDCHVPKEWGHKIVRKIRASNELLHKALGSINTREKFEAKRLQLAQNEWRRMKKTNSRECRNCHDYDSMDYTAQGRRAYKRHITAVDDDLLPIKVAKLVGGFPYNLLMRRSQYERQTIYRRTDHFHPERARGRR
jgi:cytochrome c-type protein NapC